jgi:hypothetical protein
VVSALVWKRTGFSFTMVYRIPPEGMMSMDVATLKPVVLAILLALALWLIESTPAGAIQYVTPAGPVAQGQVTRILLNGITSGSRIEGFWQGKPLMFFQLAESEFAALVGVDLRLKPGNYPLKFKILPPGGDSINRNANVEVVAKDYGVERLRLPKKMVSLDEPTLKRVRREQAIFTALWKKQTPERYWSGPFTMPVTGKRLSPFGLRRIINDEPRSPHSGLDVRAPLGEPIRAANRGRVALVGEFFFAGNAVVIDHGLGLYTMYFHLSEQKVAQGDRVEKGSVIGLAGATGRASGPHLHWGVRLDGARIDPLELIRITSE